MFDHPGWVTNAEGVTHRVVRQGSGVVSVAASPVEQAYLVEATAVRGAGDAPDLVVVDPKVLRGPAVLVEPLREAGCVARVGNSDLWDAVATSILRQVIRARHARRLYEVACRAFGEQVYLRHGTSWLFPSAEVVLALPEAEFARLGLRFKRRPLQAAARAYLEHGAAWVMACPAELVTELQRVPRVGPWTAGAAVADVTNDYSHYPFADLAVRTWAQRLAPGLQWPARESQFAEVWRELAGDQLSAWTLLTLAWGVRNARTGGALRL